MRQSLSAAGSVLILAGKGDEQARRVATRLEALGVSAPWCDTGAFPAVTKACLEGEACRWDGCELTPPRAVYVRGLATHPLSADGSGDLETRPRGLIAQYDEKRAFLESMLLNLERRGTQLVNSLDANNLHNLKPLQLRLLADAGLPVPPWIAANDPEAVKAFAGQHGQVVYKPLAGGARVLPVTDADLSDSRLEQLRLAPVLFQKRVEGLSLRVFVVGDSVVGAAAIHSDDLDYRGNETLVEAVTLSAEEERAALLASAACGMHFSGVDLIRTEPAFTVLEANPSPMFATFEDLTGMDIAGPLSDFLAGARQ